MELVISPEASSYIGDRGGRVYLWQEAVGRSWVTDHMGFIDPNRKIPFTPVWFDGVALMLADDLELPGSIRIRLNRVPRRLRVEWEGERWGRRGGAEGAADYGG
jgi:hypothetical protein